METHLADLCQHLKDHVELDVVVSSKGRETTVDQVDGVKVTRLGAAAHLLSSPINPELVTRLRRTNADIVHLHWPHPLALLAYMASGSTAHLVITYHSDIVRQKITGKLLEPILERALRKATIIPTSPNYMESSALLGRFRENCRVVPLGIDPHRVNQASASRVNEFRARYGNRMILATGRQVPYKGFRYLIEAMREVNGHLVLVGDGPLRGELQAQAAQAGLDNKITFAGQVSDEDLRAYYAACAIFAFPSVERSEAFGLVQLEAMAAGKPVVNTDVNSGVPYVSVHEETGLTAKVGDVQSLAGHLNTLLNNEHLQTHYGNAARRRVLEKFTLEKMSSQVLAVYDEVMSKASDRATAVAATA